MSPLYEQRLDRMMDSNRAGDIAEYAVIVWAWKQGYEVFPNAGCTGDVDLILLKDGITILVDVKHATVRHGTWQTNVLSKQQIEKDIQRILYFPDYDIVLFDPNIPRNSCTALHRYLQNNLDIYPNIIERNPK